MSRTLRVGWLAPVQGLLAGLHFLTLIGAAAGLPWLVRHPTFERTWVIGIAAAAATPAAALVLTTLPTLLRARRLQRTTQGRGRLLTLTVASLVHLLALAPVVGLGAWAVRQALDRGLLVTFDPMQALLALPPTLAWAFHALAAVAAVSCLVMTGAALVSWGLIAERVRTRLWLAIDTCLLAAVGVASWTLPLQPPDESTGALLASGTRLGITGLFVARAVARLLPVVLDLVERGGFQALVAARHLRARKSRFLAAIGTLSVLAVAFSSCSLTTTLSVMGGFRNDLKSKILGNNAHIQIDHEKGALEDWKPLLERVRSHDGVVGATPYVSGEVMVTSASNLAGGMLRGVDRKTIDNVTDLEENLVQGKLDYLASPEKLLDLPADKRTGPMQLEPKLGDEGEPSSAGAPPRTHDGPDEGSVGQTKSGGPIGDFGPMVGGPGKKEAPDGNAAREAERLDEESQQVLPGIIVGRELARTLRLYVGDEVNVVSPFGDLGPTGPMPKSRPFRVAGIFYSGMYEYDMKSTYVSLGAAQRFFKTADAVTGIDVKVAQVDQAPQIANALRARLDRDGIRVRDWQQLNENLFGALALEKLAMFITLGIAILVAGFCVFGTLTLMVQEKGREVAILKAMGTGRRSIVGVFLVEGGLIGVFGAAVGLGLGFVACYAAEHLGIRMNPEVYYIDKLPVHIDPMEFVLVGTASVGVCLAATIFPAVLASRLPPVDALRYE